MIRLSAETPLCTGRHRKCYAHPDDAQRCIKIVYNSGHGGDKETQRELKYYAHLSRYLKDWSGIPRSYGWLPGQNGSAIVSRKDCGSVLSPNRYWPSRWKKTSTRKNAADCHSLRARRNADLMQVVAGHKRLPTQLTHLTQYPRLTATHIA